MALNDIIVPKVGATGVLTEIALAPADIGAAAASHAHAISDVTNLQTTLDGKQASGSYATLESGKVPATQLPSYVDDVLEFANLAAFPASGETGKIYVTLDTNKTYRWSGSAYVEISASSTLAHASSHHTGGTDAIAPNNIGAGWALAVSGQMITGNTLLSSGRNRRILLSVVAAANVDLPYENNVDGDLVTLVSAPTGGLTATIRAPGYMFEGVPFTYTTLATLTAVGQSFTFVSNGTATGWTLQSVNTHTHPATAISDSTAAGRALLTGADAAAQRTSLGLGTIATANLDAIPETLRIVGGTDPTKKLAFEVDTLVSTATTRTLTVPNSSGTIALNETFAAPPAIGNTTPNSGAFSTLSVGATNPDITVVQLGNRATNTLTAYGTNYGSQKLQVNFDHGLNINNTNGDLSFGSAEDVVLRRDDANILAQRRDNNPQNFRLYGSYSLSNIFERLSIRAQFGNNFIIATEKGNTGGAPRGLEFQTDGVTRLTLPTDGTVRTAGNLFVGGSGVGFYYPGGAWAGVGGSFAVAGPLSLNNSLNAIITSDAADIIAIRRGAVGQTFRVYNVDGGANFERGFMRWSSNVLQIGTEKGGTGTARALELQTDGVTRLTIGAGSGNASSITSAATIYANGNDGFGYSLRTAGVLLAGGIQAGVIGHPNNGAIGWSFTWPSGIISTGAAVTALNLSALIVRIGGTTNAFPALKRSSTTLQVRLADDSAFTDIAASNLVLTDNTGAETATFDAQAKLTANRTYDLPDASGTIALLETLPAGGPSNFWIPASAWIPKTTAGCGVDSRETTTNDQNFDELLFDTGADEFADALVVMPSNYNNGTVTARFYWTAASGSGGVAWGIQGRAFANDDALDTAAGTAQLVTDTLIAANDMHITAATSAVTIGGTPAANTPIQFTIYRDVSDAADTLGVDARLLGVEIIYTAA